MTTDATARVPRSPRRRRRWCIPSPRPRSGKKEIESLGSESLAIAKSHEARAEYFEQAVAFNYAGLLYKEERDFKRAIDFFKRALALYERLGETTRKGQTLQNLALGAGRAVEARGRARILSRGAAGARRAGNPKLFADTINNLALNEMQLGRVDESLRQYSKALDILTRIQQPREQARSLNGIGYVYLGVGKRSEALAYFSRALAIRTREVDAGGGSRCAPSPTSSAQRGVRITRPSCARRR